MTLVCYGALEIVGVIIIIIKLTMLTIEHSDHTCTLQISLRFGCIEKLCYYLNLNVHFSK